MFKVKAIKTPIVKYNPIFVKDICKLANIGASKLNKFLISNWSNGLQISVYKFDLTFNNYYNIYLDTHKIQVNM